MILEEKQNELEIDESNSVATSRATIMLETGTKGKYDKNVHTYMSKTNIAESSVVVDEISSALDQFKLNRMRKEDVCNLIVSKVMKETIEQIGTHRTDVLKKLFSVPRIIKTS